MDLINTLETIATFLEENDFRYALIGGLALAAYGHARSTLDVDLVVERDQQDRIIDFMESNGFDTLHHSDGYSNHSYADDKLRRVDFVYVRGETADRLFDSTINFASPDGLNIPVPRPEHLIAMKVLAMKNDPERTFQELADIRALMSRPKVDRQEIRRYFDKHGLLERFHELDRSL